MDTQTTKGFSWRMLAVMPAQRYCADRRVGFSEATLSRAVYAMIYEASFCSKTHHRPHSQGDRMESAVEGILGIELLLHTQPVLCGCCRSGPDFSKPFILIQSTLSPPKGHRRVSRDG